jgi:hypothetical protein
MQQMYSEPLDELSASVSAAWNQSLVYDGTIIPAILQESSVSFAFNYSQWTDRGVIWSSNRQMMHELSDDSGPYDYLTIKDETFADSTADAAQYYRTLTRYQYDSYRNNLQILLHREGPCLGSMDSCFWGNVTEIQASQDKSVRCYNFTLTQSLLAVKCIQIGSGWRDAETTHSQFSIGDTDLRSAGSVSVDIYGATKGAPLYQKDWGCITDSNSQKEA